MSENSKERIVTLVGIDLAKNSFHAYGADAAGKMVFSKKLSRASSARSWPTYRPARWRWKPAAVPITGHGGFAPSVMRCG
jgi:hypothetical protein